MRNLFKTVFICLFLLAGTTPSFAGEEEKQALILEVLHLTGVLEMFETMKTAAGDQLETNLKASGVEFTDNQINATKEVMFEVFDEMRPELVKVIIKIHNENYTEDELRQLVTFYKTDLGKMLLNKIPQIASQVMAETNAIVIKMQPELQRRITEALAKIEPENKS